MATQQKDLVIRPAEARDDAFLGELLVDAFVSAYAKKRPEFSVSPARQAELRDTQARRLGALVLVAEREGDVLGTLTLYLAGNPLGHAWEAGFAELRFVAARTDLHGQGVGRALVSAALAEAMQAGNAGISIRVRRGLTRLVAFYQSFGFERDARGDQDKSPTLLDGYTLRF